MFVYWILISLISFSSIAQLKASESSFSKEELPQKNFFSTTFKKSTYFALGSAFEALSLASDAAWALHHFLPEPLISKNEYLLFKSLSKKLSSRFFAGQSKEPISPYSSWYLNQKLLSTVPTSTEEDKNLVLFLENRWLAKSTGFFPSWVQWICPVFDISLQIHPETGPSYARSPAIFLFKAYQKKVNAWKRSLPHPYFFPLVLTRPFDLQNFLPSYYKIHRMEELPRAIQKASITSKNDLSKKVVLDISSLFSQEANDSTKWLKEWNAIRARFLTFCKKKNIDLTSILCIENIIGKEIGGIRLLPLASLKQMDSDHELFLGWISRCGLAANPIELDRALLSKSSLFQKKAQQVLSNAFLSKEEFLSSLDSFLQNLSFSSEKKVLLEGILFPLQGLLQALSEKKWNSTLSCPTKSSIIEIAFSNIDRELKILQEKGNAIPFFEISSHAEQIHANLCTLLEIFSSFTHEDFPVIYQSVLSPPSCLQPFISCALHSSGMTSLTGILQATKNLIGTSPEVLYGENTYYESIFACESIAKTAPIVGAKDEEIKKADLLIMQFNPVWKGTTAKSIYQLENIFEILKKSLQNRTKPLVLALDCTLDYLFSSKVAKLFEEFQNEILKGTLSIICYRSGLKFDLFGMDNYAGAPPLYDP